MFHKVAHHMLSDPEETSGNFIRISIAPQQLS